MTDNFIQLGKRNTLKIGIKDEEGNILDGVLEFDLEDTGLLLKYQDMADKIQKDKQWLRNQKLIISKRQDIKGKKLLSKNEEDILRAEQEFFKRIADDYNMFLGENGTQKLLNGRNLGWITINEIDNIILEQIEPYLMKHKNTVIEDIKKKYNQTLKNIEKVEVIK